MESVLRRDRSVVAAALLLLTGLAWAYVLWLATTPMPGMDMSAGDMTEMMAPIAKPWPATDLVFVFAMWAVMMVGMMRPAAAPMIPIYARVGVLIVARASMLVSGFHSTHGSATAGHYILLIGTFT